ncbi:MAG: NADP-dependent phosphogluconate dehydrogenase [Acidobacteria bacterium]|nr:NADP-dependent phosphogluconate dehydrogenase [Acidobacteriota bacterium]MCW5967093.1 NADP-dependent phosphogluconate dehydrogenase [Blastocatellales bacterium]
MSATPQARIGLIGLAVMGENLALNIARNEFPIAVFNRDTSKVDRFLARAQEHTQGRNVIGAYSLPDFVAALELPRKIVLLVKAGEAVDAIVNQLKPLLSPGDIIIDGGNSNYVDTRRREHDLKAEGFRFIGSGVSGGESGALWGPSLMPGGDPSAYEEIRPIWEKISAQVDDGPCVTYVGPDGAGHFVKMVHNGIEYGDMQLIAEAYGVLKHYVGLSNQELAETFAAWNEGTLNSFLIEITAKIFRAVDPETGQHLLDLILDEAGQKGTGKWTAQIALELGVPIPTMQAALDARVISSHREQRREAAAELHGPEIPPFSGDRAAAVAAVGDALYASKICSYAQGMNLIRAGSDHFNWGMNLGELSRIWKGGCIIRAQFLDRIKQAYLRRPDLPNLLLDPDFKAWVLDAQPRWRQIVSTSQALGIPVAAMSASLSYFDTYRAARLPLNLTQAQRDFFGSHTYVRTDRPEAGAVHTEWESLIN